MSVESPLITPVQCRTGRQLLGLTVGDLSARSGLSAHTIMSFEQGSTMFMSDAVAKPLRRTMEIWGVEFGADGVTVRLSSSEDHDHRLRR